MTWSRAANHLVRIVEAGQAAGWSRQRIEEALDQAIDAHGYTEADLRDAQNAIQAALRH